LGQELVAQLPTDVDIEQGWHQMLGILSHQIEVTDDDILTRGGIVALVGPTGVGKTTCVAKLAARYSLRHGNRQVALISTDSYRIGAQEQLMNFGRILDVPTYAVNDAKELSDRLKDLADKRLVLIDTAGMSQRDIHLSEQLQTLSDCSSRIKTYLVMAANTQASALREVTRTFSKSQLEGCILTKIDETSILGDALSTLIRYQLPIAYFSDGQRVPEDMHPARAHSMISRAVSLMQQQEMISEKYPNTMNINRNMANAHV
jgi:flagellar biosynthesis protein FlhF